MSAAPGASPTVSYLLSEVNRLARERDEVERREARLRYGLDRAIEELSRRPERSVA
jgi:hypothetical protein